MDRHQGENGVFATEDISKLIDDAPELLQAPLTSLNYSMMTHNAYNNPSYKWSKNDFELGTPLGKGIFYELMYFSKYIFHLIIFLGKFGRVYIAREKRTKFMVAMKILFKSELIKGRVEKQVILLLLSPVSI